MFIDEYLCPRFLEKVFSAAQKTFSKNEDSEAILII